MPRAPSTKPRKSASQARSRLTVDALLEATARVLVRGGYDRASTNRIALKAGVSVGSLYQYFPSKEALVAALVDRHKEQMSCVLVEQLEGVATKEPEQVVRDVIRAVVNAHGIEPKLHAVLTEQVPRVGRLQKLVEFNRRVATMVRGYLETISGRLQPKNIDAATFILVSSVEAVTRAMVTDDTGIPPKVLEDELTVLVCRYLFTPLEGAGSADA